MNESIGHQVLARKIADSEKVGETWFLECVCGWKAMPTGVTEGEAGVIAQLHELNL